jgi:hypothetical protein
MVLKYLIRVHRLIVLMKLTRTRLTTLIWDEQIDDTVEFDWDVHHDCSGEFDWDAQMDGRGEFDWDESDEFD